MTNEKLREAIAALESGQDVLLQADDLEWLRALQVEPAQTPIARFKLQCYPECGAWMDADENGDYVRYSDIAHLLTVEPNEQRFREALERIARCEWDGMHDTDIVMADLAKQALGLPTSLNPVPVLEPTGWQPIETLPEGEHVLLYFPIGEKGIGGMEAATVYRETTTPCGYGFWTHGGPNAGGDWDSDEAPTHWMPLPQPPNRRGES